MSAEANPTTERVASHTPAPWGLSNDEGSERYEIGINADVGVKIICSVDYGFDEPFDSQQHANARLIAAAPELLAALKRILGAVYPGTEKHHETGCRCFIHEAQQAIAKATGEHS
jgi:hypothetical protein